jgi:uncharacterized protein (DUF2236 family)
MGEQKFAFGEPDVLTPDPGLFGPDSMSWRIHADPSATVGGVRALLLQGLHPEAMAGVEAHSIYREDPWGRLFRTAEYIAVITFGTTAEANSAATKVRELHKRLGLDKPEWLLWVHAGFTDSLLDSAIRSGMPISPSQADQYVREQVMAARLIGYESDDIFTSHQELKRYFAQMRPFLGADEKSRAAAKFLLLPPMPAKARFLTPAQTVWAGVTATAFASLPSWAREMYGGSSIGPVLANLPLGGAATSASMWAWRKALLAIPSKVRKSPHVAAAEQRLGLVA